MFDEANYRKPGYVRLPDWITFYLRACQAQRSMLCTSCHNKPHCLAAQLAESDAVVDQLLRQLKRCSLRPRRTVWQRVNAFWRSLWGSLRLALNR